MPFSPSAETPQAPKASLNATCESGAESSPAKAAGSADKTDEAVEADETGEAGAANEPVDTLKRFPVEIWEHIASYCPTQSKRRLRLGTKTLQAVVDTFAPFKRLLITVGCPPSLGTVNRLLQRMRGKEQPAPADVRGELLAYHQKHPPEILTGWNFPLREFDQLQLSSLDELGDELVGALSKEKLHTLWVHELQGDGVRSSGGPFDLARLVPLGALQHLRLDVRVQNPKQWKLPSVRQLCLWPNIYNRHEVNLLRTFPALELLTCDVQQLLGSKPCLPQENCGHGVTELCLLRSEFCLYDHLVNWVCSRLSKLQRLRLEDHGIGRIYALALFGRMSEMLELEFTGTQPSKPDFNWERLRSELNRIQSFLKCAEGKKTVTLWGVPLQPGAKQADEICKILRDRWQQTGADAQTDAK